MHLPLAKMHALLLHSRVEWETLCRSNRSRAFFGAWLRLRTFLFSEDDTMPDYEKLYHLMVNASEDALSALEAGEPEKAREILLAAEIRAEELYIAAGN